MNEIERGQLRETACRILAHGVDVADVGASVAAAASDADLTSREAADVARIGRHVWTSEEWLEMGLYRLIALG